MPTLTWLTRGADEQVADRVPCRGVELGEHAVTPCEPRLRKVIDGGAGRHLGGGRLPGAPAAGCS